MTELKWIRSHVELLLQRQWGIEEVNADCDGDFPYHFGTALCWVSALERAEPMVRVFAHAVCGVKQSAKLLAESNDI